MKTNHWKCTCLIGIKIYSVLFHIIKKKAKSLKPNFAGSCDSLNKLTTMDPRYLLWIDACKIYVQLKSIGDENK